MEPYFFVRSRPLLIACLRSTRSLLVEGVFCLNLARTSTECHAIFTASRLPFFIENLGSLKKSAYGSLWPLAAWFISRTLFRVTWHDWMRRSARWTWVPIAIYQLQWSLNFFEQNFHLVLFPHKEHYLQIMRDFMTNFLYEARLQGIMVDLFIILDLIPVLMNIPTMTPHRLVSERELPLKLIKAQ